MISRSRSYKGRNNLEEEKKKPIVRRIKGQPNTEKFVKLEIQNKIVQYILLGSYVETAATASGISKETFYEWLRRGAKAKRMKEIPENEMQYVRFSDAVDHAVGQSEQRDLYRIEKAAETGDWRAAAWKLERRAPTRWGPKAAMKLETDKEGFSDSENIHKQIAELVSKHERGEILNEGTDSEDL